MNIGIICGGQSGEHEISIITALQIYHKVKEINLFYYVDKGGNIKRIRKPSIKHLRHGFPLHLKKHKIGFKSIDCMVIAMHGKNGEDGQMAALLDFYDIPYVGSSQEGSLLSFDKSVTHKVLEKEIPMVSQKTYFKNEEIVLTEFPVIVKPARSGSSLGISVVKEETELGAALKKALVYDSKVVLEQYLSNAQEASVAVYKDFEVNCSKVEIIKPKEALFSFEEKYYNHHKEQKHEYMEDNSLSEEIKSYCVKIYQQLELKDIVRMDFLISEGKIYFNEVNTIPGSLSNYMIESFDKVLLSLIERSMVEHNKISFPSIQVGLIGGKK